jgi:hypothetical protein
MDDELRQAINEIIEVAFGEVSFHTLPTPVQLRVERLREELIRDYVSLYDTCYRSGVQDGQDQVTCP